MKLFYQDSSKPRRPPLSSGQVLALVPTWISKQRPRPSSPACSCTCSQPMHLPVELHYHSTLFHIHGLQLKDESTIQNVATAAAARPHQEEGGRPRCIYAPGQSTPLCDDLKHPRPANMVCSPIKKSQDASATLGSPLHRQTSRIQNHSTYKWSSSI